MSLREEALQEAAADENRRTWRQAAEQPASDRERKQQVFMDEATLVLDRSFGPREWRVAHYEPGFAGVGAHDRGREYAVIVEAEDEKGELPLFVCWNAYRYADRRDEGHIETYLAEPSDPSDGGIPWVQGPKVHSLQNLGRELLIKEADHLAADINEGRARAAHDVIAAARELAHHADADDPRTAALSEAVTRYENTALTEQPA